MSFLRRPCTCHRSKVKGIRPFSSLSLSLSPLFEYMREHQLFRIVVGQSKRGNQKMSSRRPRERYDSENDVYEHVYL